ncbi:DUF4041 domain-containing protein [Rathayibacter sp. VKM Ac-2760]|uniref:DUF4041 domain-containing protein n=1 Tax=Rathayibacter sp. VKM Ac-2760 TaxID=2609253 RepID=UPI0013170310|nr:DUF4041 domain-containing protein [Rathayibacter sp. VKM Ac-2760]QHC60247.1 DUF4041 domain-containing protein [Rathayibacter sp. VKM Ac-2760]
MTAPANWYPDPTDSSILRYWDGTAWTHHTHPVAPAEPIANEEPLSRRESRRAERTVEAVHDVPAGASTESSPDIPFFGARKVAKELAARVAELERAQERYGMLELTELDSEKSRRRAEIAEERARWQHDVTTRTEEESARAASSRAVAAEIDDHIALRRRELEDVQSQIIGVRQTIDIQELGLYDYEHPAEASADLATRLEVTRSRIKAAIRDKKAARASSGFTFNGSEAQGRKFVSDMTKILLRAYNAEAENCVKTVRAGSLAVAQARLSKAAEMIERQGSMITLTIDPEYHHLRLTEIQLANQHLQALAREKELERARREELREQRKAEQELAREHERLDKEKAHYTATLTALEANGDLEGAERLRARIADVERALHDVDYRAANIRAGYVYVISNRGAFGDRMVKIGMTRRLEPMDRVNELGDASVPFRFDVHALFFADDAVGIETMLHQTFSEKRVNRVNLRREFFYVTPDDVLEVLRAHSVEILEFRTEVASEEYLASVTPTTGA